jgi:hypothetical protein
MSISLFGIRQRINVGRVMSDDPSPTPKLASCKGFAPYHVWSDVLVF